MAQFDLYRLAGAEGLIVDCQSDLLSDLPTRFVIPLVADMSAALGPPRLNPVLAIDHVHYVLLAHLPAALPRGLFREPVGSAEEHRLAIQTAIDVLLAGV